jgi:hypothetical protein
MRKGKKGSKDGAYKKWHKLINGKTELFGHPPPTAEQLITAAKIYAKHCGQNDVYAKDAVTWLGPDNHWKEYLPQAHMPNAPPDFDLVKYCTNGDGTIDGAKLVRTRRALEGDPDYAQYRPQFVDNMQHIT